MRVVCAIVFLCISASAQQVEFEVVSVKPNNSHSYNMGIEDNKGMWRATNITPKMLIVNAYEILEDQLLGVPSWADSERFDIQGKYEDQPGPNAGQRRELLRLQSLLADRFQFKMHRETREGKGYFLVVAKNGPKLTPASVPQGMTASPGHMEFKGTTIEMLARNLASRVHGPVMDHTGLTGRYDLTIDYDPDPMGSGPSDSPKPSLFTALQEQVGLKLEPTKAPIEMLVIDRIERPTAN